MAEIFQYHDNTKRLKVIPSVDGNWVHGSLVASRGFPFKLEPIMDFIKDYAPFLIYNRDNLEVWLEKILLKRIYVVAESSGGIDREQGRRYSPTNNRNGLFKPPFAPYLSFETMGKYLRLWWGPFPFRHNSHDLISDESLYSDFCTVYRDEVSAYLSKGHNTLKEFKEIFLLDQYNDSYTYHMNVGLHYRGDLHSMPYYEHDLVGRGNYKIFSSVKPANKPLAVLFNDGTYRINHRFEGDEGRVKLTDEEKSNITQMILSYTWNYYIVDEQLLHTRLVAALSPYRKPIVTEESSELIDTLTPEEFSDSLLNLVRTHVPDEDVRQAISHRLGEDTADIIQDQLEVLINESII